MYTDRLCTVMFTCVLMFTLHTLTFTYVYVCIYIHDISMPLYFIVPTVS